MCTSINILVEAITYYVAFVFVSVRRSDTWCKGEAAESEGSCAHANQGDAYYNEEDSLWWRIENVGSLPDAHPQAPHWLA